MRISRRGWCRRLQISIPPQKQRASAASEAQPILKSGTMRSAMVLTIVSKDSDFAERSARFGSPPKVIWLRIGNCTTARVEFVLRKAAQRIKAFQLEEESCLVLTLPVAGRAHPLQW